MRTRYFVYNHLVIKIDRFKDYHIDFLDLPFLVIERNVTLLYHIIRHFNLRIAFYFCKYFHGQFFVRKTIPTFECLLF